MERSYFHIIRVRMPDFRGFGDRFITNYYFLHCSFDFGPYADFVVVDKALMIFPLTK